MNIDDVLKKVYNSGNTRCTISGGEPLAQPLQVKRLVTELKAKNFHVILYTGYTWEYLIDNHDDILEHVDIVVDGKFEQDKLCTHTYKGSANQRIIDVAKSLYHREPILHADN